MVEWALKKEKKIKESDLMKERDTHTKKKKKKIYSYYLSKEKIFF